MNLIKDEYLRKNYSFSILGEGMSEEVAREHTLNHRAVITAMENAKTVLFSCEQAKIFWGKENKAFSHRDFMLPYEDLIIQFDCDLDIPDAMVHGEGCRGILLHSEKYTKLSFRPHMGNMIKVFPQFWDLMATDEDFIWSVAATYIGKEYLRTLFWFESQGRHAVATVGADSHMHLVRSIIGYINCENVYLHKEGEVDEAINRKRERKGKRRLEPYYVCRIRGVNYESQATGDGTKHGHRYDVRGHFRRLDDGRVTWVRPHQRGLANELYIPKVYKVDKE